jgi:hypothetical protein
MGDRLEKVDVSEFQTLTPKLSDFLTNPASNCKEKISQIGELHVCLKT